MNYQKAYIPKDKPKTYFQWVRMMLKENGCRVGNKADLSLNEKIIHIKSQIKPN